MFRSQRSFLVPELGAGIRSIEARTEHVRLSWHHGTKVTSDYQLLELAAPFIHKMSRSAMTIVLEGAGRFEEGERRIWTRPGELVMSDAIDGGTEAYAGETTSLLVVEWSPDAMGAPTRGGFRSTRLTERDRARIRALVPELGGLDPAAATIQILDLLRACGIGFHRHRREDLVDRSTDADRKLSAAIDAQLSQLESHPAIEDAAAEMGWSARHANRRFAAIAKSHHLPWEHWRAILHHTRLCNAFRLLSVPGATTELVARRTGYRSPNALCHAFAKVGLPSPQTLAAAARRDVLDTWAALVKPRRAA